MAPISNTQIIRRFTSEFINTASPTLAAELISPTAVFHASGMPPLRGPEGYLGLLGMLRVGFPDVQWTLEDTVVEGDKVAARFTMRGTHTGPFMGIPPSGQPFSVTSMGIYRIADGQIVEEQGVPDMLGNPAADRCHPATSLASHCSDSLYGRFRHGWAAITIF